MASSLWGGRFEKEMDDIVKKYNASIGFDQRMYNEDIDGSIAHVTMLGEQDIISEEEKKVIVEGLEEIRADIKSGKIVFNVDDEDIHMGVESRLIQRIGDVGKKLHTARRLFQALHICSTRSRLHWDLYLWRISRCLKEILQDLKMLMKE